jgi:hypothetical protein
MAGHPERIRDHVAMVDDLDIFEMNHYFEEISFVTFYEIKFLYLINAIYHLFTTFWVGSCYVILIFVTKLFQNHCLKK